MKIIVCKVKIYKQEQDETSTTGTHIRESQGTEAVYYVVLHINHDEWTSNYVMLCTITMTLTSSAPGHIHFSPKSNKLNLTLFS